MIPSLRNIIDKTYDTGYNAGKGREYPPDIVQRNAMVKQFEADLNTLRLILRNCGTNLDKKNWLQSDLELAERFLAGQIYSFNVKQDE